MGQLTALPTPQERWRDISMDYLTDLPVASESTLFAGAVNVLVVVDRLSKERHLIPTHSLEALHLAKLMIQHVFRAHGLPDSIVSDRGSQFTSPIWAISCQLLGIRRKLSTAYHPETDGQSERMIQDTEQKLRQLVNFAQNDWPDWLPITEFSMNNQMNEATRMSPFFATRGFHPRMGVEPVNDNEESQEPTERPRAIDTEMKLIIDDLRANLSLTKQLMEDRSSATPSPRYQVGDKVWLSTKNMRTKRPCRKLDDKWVGPLTIKRVINGRAYELDLPPEMRLHPVFYVNLLRPAAENPLLGQRNDESSLPGPVVGVDDEPEEWEVEEIVGKRLRGRRKQIEYRVKWVGWPNEHNTWEPVSNLANSAQAIANFESRQVTLGGPRALGEGDVTNSVT